MFIDEIYTYGLSNPSYAPFLSDVKGGSLDHKTVTRDELLDYVSVTGDEGFDFGSVYYNQVHDVHPPLYYWLFNIASTFAGGRFSKWTGLVLDGILYLGTVAMLYALARKMVMALWHALMGHPMPCREPEICFRRKLAALVRRVGAARLKAMGYNKASDYVKAVAEPLYAHLPRKTATKENKAEESA